MKKNPISLSGYNQQTSPESKVDELQHLQGRVCPSGHHRRYPASAGQAVRQEEVVRGLRGKEEGRNYRHGPTGLRLKVKELLHIQGFNNVALMGKSHSLFST